MTLTSPTATRVHPRPSPDGSATVSVVIPCFNYARYLRQSVGSALGQRGADVDVVIVDDASTDDSVAVARSLVDADPRVRLLEHRVNLGPVDTFNDGLAATAGEFLVRLDADDMLTPGSLERAIAVARELPTVGLVYGHPLHFSGEPGAEPRTTATAWTHWRGGAWLADRCRSGFNVITAPEAFMRRDVVDVVGGQRYLAHTHDMEMWLRIAAFSDVAYIHGADQAWHREHPASLSATSVSPLVDVRERRAAFDTLFSGAAGRLPGSASLHAAARRAVAVDALTLACQRLDARVVDHTEVDLLVEFAEETDASARELPEWRAVTARLRVADGTTQRHPRFVLERLGRRIRADRNIRRWHRQGTF
ncbi:glycosyltransferase family 2 protein [Glaciihabitans sp. dw_435]|uniref:glycosyltransferase family 2 protein n=1 Tax=Glaciihabitans sp. dw_435 TaxID=2720081 RepID=UPI001BD372A2|nr:glycosyltransferase family 2 protein [Glaciihabitans sp. dw_435]